MQNIQQQQGFDTSPIASLYDRYAQLILTSVSRYTTSKEDADDLVLEVFVAAMERPVWTSWTEQEQLAWLKRIAQNKAIDHYRRTTRRPSVVLEHVEHTLFEDDERMPEHVALRNEDYALLRAHLTNLSELQQEIIQLRFGHGLRAREIGQRLNKTDNVIRVMLSRALNALRTIYQQQEEV